VKIEKFSLTLFVKAGRHISKEQRVKQSIGKKHKIITPPQCLSRTRVKRVTIIQEFKKCLQNIQNIKIKCLKINKNKAPHKINHP
jgi:hypothetical protein